MPAFSSEWKSGIVEAVCVHALIFCMNLGMPTVLPTSSPPAPRKSRCWLFIVLSLARAALLGFLLIVGAGALFVLTAKEQPLSRLTGL